MKEEFTAAEVSRITGHSAASVAKLCRTGRVPGAEKAFPEKPGAPQGEWRIPKESVEVIEKILKPPRAIAASRSRGAAARTLWTLRLLTEKPSGIAADDLARELERRFGTAPSRKAITSYIHLLEDAEYPVATYRRANLPPIYVLHGEE